jgi:hypothetical protein
MLTKRLFLFGYETPSEVARNARHEWDDESSAGVWIVSASEEEAITWGRTVAEGFVSSLFGHDGSGYSWIEANFACWIETDPNRLAVADNLPVVTIGEMPDFVALANAS